MATLLCLQYPELAILDRRDGSWVKFVGGRLDIDDDHPSYGTVMAEAARNPAIAVYQSLSTCPHCGEDTTSKKALDGHVKEIHFDKWIAGKDVETAAERVALVKDRSGVACDACTPPGVYPNEDDLALHVKIVHAAKPDLGPNGEGDGGSGPGLARGRAARPGEVDPDAEPAS